MKRTYQKLPDGTWGVFCEEMLIIQCKTEESAIFLVAEFEKQELLKEIKEQENEIIR